MIRFLHLYLISPGHISVRLYGWLFLCSAFQMHCFWSLLMSSLSFNASRQHQTPKNTGNERCSFFSFFLSQRAKRNIGKNKTLLEKMMEKERNTKNNSFWCCNILYYYQHRTSAFTFSQFTYTHMCLCVSASVECELSATIAEQVDNQARRINIKTALMTFIMLLNIWTRFTCPV